MGEFLKGNTADEVSITKPFLSNGFLSDVRKIKKENWTPCKYILKNAATF